MENKAFKPVLQPAGVLFIDAIQSLQKNPSAKNIEDLKPPKAKGARGYIIKPSLLLCERNFWELRCKRVLICWKLKHAQTVAKSLFKKKKHISNSTHLFLVFIDFTLCFITRFFNSS